MINKLATSTLQAVGRESLLMNYVQSCSLDGWTKNDLIYTWKQEGALQFAPNLSLPGGFILADTGNQYCDVKTSTGEYSCLQVDLLFSREVSYYIITIYLPTMMIVIVSWFSFWIDHKSAPARINLSVTTLLAINTTMASIQGVQQGNIIVCSSYDLHQKQYFPAPNFQHQNRTI